MLLRISLIIALLAGIGAGVVGWVYVQKKMVETMNDRDTQKKDKETAQADLSKTKKELGVTQKNLADTRDALNKANNSVTSLTERNSVLDKRVLDIGEVLKKVTADRDSAQQELTRWSILGVKPEDIILLQTNHIKLQAECDAHVKENKLLNEKNIKLQNKLADIIGTNGIPDEPPGLTGKIVAVDPKYQFVVLDIGGNQGLITRGHLLVNRNGKFMGKVAVASVDTSSSVANIIPEWQQGDLLEGDLVISTKAE